MKIFDEIKTTYLKSLLKKAKKASDEGRYSQQILLCEKVLSKITTPKSQASIYFKALLGSAIGYKSVGDIERSQGLLERARIEYSLEPDELYTDILSRLTDIYMLREDYVTAEKILIELTGLKKQLDLPSDFEYAYDLANFAFLHQKRGDFIMALQLNENSLELILASQGLNSLAYANVAKNIADVHWEAGNKNLAKEYADRALKVYQEILDPYDLELVKVLNMFGKLYFELSEIDQAENCLQKALTICEVDSVQNKTLYAELLNNLAALYDQKGEFTLVEKLFLRSLQITEEMVGKNHPDYANVLNKLGTFYELKADFTKAIEKYIEAISVYTSQSELPKTTYLATINNLASNYVAIGKYREAEQLLTESVALHYVHFGGAHPEYASALCNSAHLHLDLGNFEKAGIEIQIAKRIYSTEAGKDSPDYSFVIILESLLCYRWGKFDEAIVLNEVALKIIRSRLGETSSEYASILNNQALLYLAISNLDKAASIMEESIRITTLNLGIDHPIAVKSTYNLGLILEKLGQWDKAEEIFLNVAFRIEQKFDQTHQLYIYSMFNLAKLKMLKRDIPSAIELTTKLIYSSKLQLTSIFPALSQSEKYRLMRNFDGLFELANTVVRTAQNSTNRQLYEWVLFRKGLVLSVTGNLNTFLAEKGDAALSELFVEWKNLVYKINQHQNISQKQRLNGDILHLSEEAEQFEKRFNQLSSSIPGFLLVPEYSWDDVVENLVEGEILIDFVKYYDLQDGDLKRDNYRYGAYVARRKTENPSFVDLVDGMDFEKSILIDYMNQNEKTGSWKPLIRNHDYSGGENPEQKAELFQCIFMPFLPYLDGVRKVFLVLDGELHLINFNSLRNPITGRYLIEEYEISYLMHPTSLKKSNTKKTPPKTASLFGYPDYNLLPDGVRGKSPMVDQYYTNQPQMAMFREHEGLHFSMLPGTLDEVELVEEVLHLQNWEVTSFTEERASEANLRDVDSPGILLIATHTFFKSNVEKDLRLSGLTVEDRKFVSDNSMTDSSLMLAGANSYLSSTEEDRLLFDDDGLFSAVEASMLRLTNTDIVILSACSSGTGSVMRGEGVFGLQRGFFSAGAKSVLMSLWKVDDNSTKELMSRFVKKYAKGIDKPTALRETQLELMKQNPDPFYWGSFVLVER